MDDERPGDLEARVAALEAQVAALRMQVYATTGAPPVAPQVVVRPTPPRAPVPPIEPLRAKREFNAEEFFGGRLLLAVGALAFLIGVGFFLKYAFDNGWIGPTGRVAIGLAGGIVIIFGGDRLFRAGQRLYAEALSGLGAAILYLSLWAAGSYFHLLPLAATFIAMIAVTAGVMAIALRRDAQRLAFAAIAGGMITPALNAGPSANLPTLFTYLAVLDTGLLFLIARRWPHFEAFTFAGTQLWVLIEMPVGFSGKWTSGSGVVVGFAFVFLALFAVPAFIRARKLPTIPPYEMAMAVLIPFACYIELYAQLYDAHRMWLTAAVVILAAAYLGAALLSRARMREISAAIALALVTIGVGITLTGASEAAAWALESAALLFIGARMNSLLIRGIGYVAFLLALDVMDAGLPGGKLFANPRFATLLVTAIALGALARGVEVLPNDLSPDRYLSQIAEAVAHVFALIAIGFELDAAFKGAVLPISLMMLAYAVALIVSGFAFKRVFTRWEGLALFGALIMKVVFVDLSSVDTIVRIISFLAVGGVLLVVAFVYQRMQTRSGETA